jgi:hypothetical protein
LANFVRVRLQPLRVDKHNLLDGASRPEIMAKTRHGIAARDPTRSVTAALKLACQLLRSGEMREAAKWASVAAGLGKPDTRPEGF